MVKLSMDARIRDARKGAGFTQASLARAIGISRAAISQFEQGRAGPSLQNLKEIARVTGKPVSFFMLSDAEAVTPAISDELATRIAVLPPAVKAVIERQVEFASRYAESLPVWLRNVEVPADGREQFISEVAKSMFDFATREVQS